ncbi:MAG: hypothetical protein ACRC92_17035 [Peptostreptococcaceae bacterium]
MKNKICALIVVGIVSVSGFLAFAGNNEYDPSIGGGCIDLSNDQDSNVISEDKKIESTQGTSEMLKEELAVKGKIDKIEVTKEGATITVGDIKVSVHTSTNIFKDDSLLEVADLEEGQSVEVYYDGVQDDVLNGLRIEVLV